MKEEVILLSLEYINKKGSPIRLVWHTQSYTGISRSLPNYQVDVSKQLTHYPVLLSN
jgi:hypothetical protein